MTSIISALSTWFAGFVIVLHFQIVWTRTGFPVHIWNFLHRDSLFTKDELLVASLRYPRWGELWVCHICAGQHVAFGAGLGLLLASIIGAPVSVWGAVLGVLSWSGCAGLLVQHEVPRRPAPRDLNPPAAPAAPRPPQNTMLSPTLATATASIGWASKTPSEEARKVVMRMVDEARVSGTIPALFQTLQQELFSPRKSDLTAEISAAFKMATVAAEGAQCRDCERGDLIRLFMAHMYDAGVR